MGIWEESTSLQGLTLWTKQWERLTRTHTLSWLHASLEIRYSQNKWFLLLQIKKERDCNAEPVFPICFQSDTHKKGWPSSYKLVLWPTIRFLKPSPFGNNRDHVSSQRSQYLCYQANLYCFVLIGAARAHRSSSWCLSRLVTSGDF